MCIRDSPACRRRRARFAGRSGWRRRRPASAVLRPDDFRRGAEGAGDEQPPHGAAMVWPAPRYWSTSVTNFDTPESTPEATEAGTAPVAAKKVTTRTRRKASSAAASVATPPEGISGTDQAAAEIASGDAAVDEAAANRPATRKRTPATRRRTCLLYTSPSPRD